MGPELLGAQVDYDQTEAVEQQKQDAAEFKQREEKKMQSIEAHILLSETERSLLISNVNTAKTQLEKMDDASGRRELLESVLSALSTGDPNTIRSLQSEFSQCGKELNEAGLTSLAEDGRFDIHLHDVVIAMCYGVKDDFDAWKEKHDVEKQIDVAMGTSETTNNILAPVIPIDVMPEGEYDENSFDEGAKIFLSFLKGGVLKGAEITKDILLFLPKVALDSEFRAELGNGL